MNSDLSESVLKHKATFCIYIVEEKNDLLVQRWKKKLFHTNTPKGQKQMAVFLLLTYLMGRVWS